MTVRVLIADDHAIMREGLRGILETDPNLQVTGEAGNGRQAVEMSRELIPDIVVMDVSMPDLNGVEATRRILADNPKVKVIALSAFTQKQFVLSMLEAGACAYVIKADASHELLGAIQAVRCGQKYLCAQVAGFVVDSYVGRQFSNDPSAATTLTGREREILQMVAEGRSSPEIAATLHLSAKTVETHRRNLMAKLGLHSVADLVKYAVREGITSLET